MTLEDISILFGDPVELSFEQALSKQEHRDNVHVGPSEVKEDASEKVESISDK
jgi:hypothetical protein